MEQSMDLDNQPDAPEYITEPVEKVDEPSLADVATEALGFEPLEPDGTEPKATVKPVEDAAPEAEKAVEKKPASKEITDDDLVKPENLSRKGSERFDKIATGYKAEKQRADTAENEATQLRDSFKALQDLGFKDEASAQDLIEFSKYRQSLAGDGKVAIAQLQKQIRMIEMRTGQNVQASALEGHDDLADEVRSERLSYQRGLEIANAREMQDRQQQQLQNQQNQQYQYEQNQQLLQGSIQSVEGLEQKWRNTDPDYSAIHPHILAAIPQIQAQFPPNQWPAQVDMLYQATKRAMAGQRRPAPSAQPLRGNGNAGSQFIPKTTSEAVLLELGFDMD
jgi:hypothetical protein